MFTGQLIGYVGADARANKNGKGFYFHVSSKFKGTGDSEDKTLWISCFVNFDTKIMDYIKKGTQVYVTGDIFIDIFKREEGTCVPSVSMNVSRVELLGRSEKKEETNS